MLTCIKYVVVIYNLIFWLLGVLILALSIFLYVDIQNYVDYNETSSIYMAPFIVLMILGAIMILVGFLGCCGAVRESTCLLGTYFIFCITMCVACGAALFWAVHNSDEVKIRLQKDFKTVIQKHYGQGAIDATEIVIDRVQTDFKCCGADRASDWALSKYNMGNKTSNIMDVGTAAISGVVGGLVPAYKVPESCCDKDGGKCQSQNAYNEGCIEKIGDFVEEKWKLVIIIGGVLIGVQLFALIFACILCCAITRAEDK